MNTPRVVDIVNVEEFKASAIAEAAIHGAIRRLRKCAEDARWNAWARAGEWRKANALDGIADSLGDIATELRIEREGWAT